MGNKILIWREIIPFSEWDVFQTVDCNALHLAVKEIYKGAYPNRGNKLWL